MTRLNIGPMVKEAVTNDTQRLVSPQPLHFIH